MIKRRFYKFEHGDRDVPSDSSSSSDSELDAEASVDTEEGKEEVEEEDVAVGANEQERDQFYSSSSGYESEDSSGNELAVDSSGLPTADDGSGGDNYKIDVNDTLLFPEKHPEMGNMHNTEDDKDAIPSDALDCVLKNKSAFKCKLCPRIVCLTEETLKAHLKSKRHARSEKLFREGRLKLMLNSDGEIEGETHQERHASTLALVQSDKKADNSKKNKGRQRQRKRLRKKKAEDMTSENTRTPAKKRRKRDI